MSEQPSARPEPEWDVADRIRKALREGGIGVTQIADYLGVSRTTVSNWINGRVPAPSPALRLIAMRTGVPFEWLCHGDVLPCRPRGIASGQRGSNFMQSLEAA